MLLFSLSAFLIFSPPARADDSCHIVVSTRDLGLGVLSRRVVILLPVPPYRTSLGTNIFSRDPRRLTNDTAGVCIFSNTLAAYYQLQIVGNPALNQPNVTYTMPLGTNHSSSDLVSAAALITNPEVPPPNPSTNYYTVAQTDALLGSISTNIFVARAAGHGTNLVSESAFYVDTAKLTDDGSGKLVAETGFIGDGSGLFNLPMATPTNTIELPGLITYSGRGIGTNLTSLQPALGYTPQPASAPLTNLANGDSNAYAGSFTGDGNGLTNIPSSSVSGAWTNTVGTRTFRHDSTATIITNTATLTGTEFAQGQRKDYYSGTNTFTVDKTNGNFNFLGTASGNAGGLSNLQSANLSGSISPSLLTTALQILNTNNGGQLTNLNASELRSGTVSDARLSTNVSVVVNSPTNGQPAVWNGTAWVSTNRVSLASIDGNLTVQGVIAAISYLRAGGASAIWWNNAAQMYSPSSTTVNFCDNTGTKFTTLLFGPGTATSALAQSTNYPALFIESSTNFPAFGIRIGTNQNAGVYGSLFVSNLNANASLFLSGTNAPIKFINVGATNAFSASATTAYIFAGTNGGGGTANSAEIYTLDGAGNYTLISPHAGDAPAGLDDNNGAALDYIVRHHNVFLGAAEWINVSRLARRMEQVENVLQILIQQTSTNGLTGLQIARLNQFAALTPAEKNIIAIRTNFVAAQSWTNNQLAVWSQYASSYTNAVAAYNAALAAGDTNAVAPAWSPPPLYPVPARLAARGVQ